MRMWMVNPKFMCNKHLIGEHCEIHMFIGSMKKNISLLGYFKNNLLDINNIVNRHEELVKEMLDRGFKHNTIINEEDIKIIEKTKTIYNNSYFDKLKAEEELYKRCKFCTIKKIKNY